MSKLRLEALTLGYEEAHPLQQDLNVALDGGSFCAIVGQNGVGKSTLLRTIAGMQQPMSGKVWLDDDLVHDLTAKSLAKMLSVVLTEKPGAQNLSVIELVALGRHPYSNWIGRLSPLDHEAIEWALERTEIQYIATKKLYQLSDGQLQKSMIARALAQRTPWILLDEPTSHLDMRNKAEVLELLRSLSSDGHGILIASHEISLTARHADQFWCLNFGKPLLTGNPEALLSSGDLHEVFHLPGHFRFS